MGVARAAAMNLARHYYHELYAGEPDLHGLQVIVDAGFGAAYAIAPYVLRKLGAEVVELNCENDGSRINVECGTTDLRQLQAAVRSSNASGNGRTMGVAFDGDADRALFVDETGAAITGDHVLFAIGCAMHARRELAGDTIVATVMSNIGFERALQNHGIALIRTAVGDRFVLQANAGGRIYVRWRAIGPSHRSSLQYDRRRSKDGRYAVGYRYGSAERGCAIS